MLDGEKNTTPEGTANWHKSSNKTVSKISIKEPKNECIAIKKSLRSKWENPCSKLI